MTDCGSCKGFPSCDEICEKRSAKIMPKMSEVELIEERAHNAILRQWLEEIALNTPHERTRKLARHVLDALPSDSAERVQKLVDALEWYAKGEHIFTFLGVDQDHAGEKARQALAEWRK